MNLVYWPCWDGNDSLFCISTKMLFVVFKRTETQHTENKLKILVYIKRKPCKDYVCVLQKSFPEVTHTHTHTTSGLCYHIDCWQVHLRPSPTASLLWALGLIGRLSAKAPRSCMQTDRHTCPLAGGEHFRTKKVQRRPIQSYFSPNCATNMTPGLYPQPLRDSRTWSKTAAKKFNFTNN